MLRGGVREVLGAVAAAAIGVIVAGQVAATARAELLFRDGDSLVVALFVRALREGQPLDWGMSSVLFVPESTVFAALSLWPLAVNLRFALYAVLSVLALYGAVRLVAGRRRKGAAPVGWSVASVATFGLIAITETSASRDSFELASLLLTTTYYGATVIAVIASIGVLRRAFERPLLGWALPVSLGVIATVSTLSNPLYAAWATAPLGILLAVIAARRAPRRTPLVLLAALVGGSLAGLLLRIPLQPWIAKSGAGYAQPSAWADSLLTYSGLGIARVQEPGGMLAAAVLLVLTGFAVVQTVRLREAGARLVAASAWMLPLAVVVGGIVLGTHAARYLQPAVFAPLLALVAAPVALPLPRPRVLPRVLIAFGAAALLVLSVVSVPRLVASATRPDADLACVTAWVNASGRTGGGQFWTVRLPKLHLADPAQLVQVHSDLDAYGWLVNRTDATAGAVSFLVDDGNDSSWQLPLGAQPDAVIACGRYRILDFGTQPLPIGPNRV